MVWHQKDKPLYEPRKTYFTDAICLSFSLLNHSRTNLCLHTYDIVKVVIQIGVFHYKEDLCLRCHISWLKKLEIMCPEIHFMYVGVMFIAPQLKMVFPKNNNNRFINLHQLNKFQLPMSSQWWEMIETANTFLFWHLNQVEWEGDIRTSLPAHSKPFIRLSRILYSIWLTVRIWKLSSMKFNLA